jgi:hypothetical protein
MLAATSAVLKDHVWFDMADNYVLHPNIYVLLYGPSGVRKGPPIALAEELVTLVDNTRVIDGRSSIEAVIKELGTFTTRPGKAPLKDSCGFMVASELSSSIIGNNSAMDIMTNLFDRQYNDKDWKYRLKVGESSKLTKPTITWLAGTNEALFRDFIPEKNINGGLIGRMLLISEHKKGNTNSLMFKTVSPNKKKLAGRLLELSQLKGEFDMSKEVRLGIDDWYQRFDLAAPELKDETGFVSRVLDFVIKTAMIISCARRGDLEITVEDVIEARDEVLPLIQKGKKVVNSIKKADNTEFTKRGLVLNYLANRPEGKEERGKILRNLGLKIDHEDLDRIAAFLIQMNVLTIDNQGGQQFLRLRMDRKEILDFVKSYQV